MTFKYAVINDQNEVVGIRTFTEEQRGFKKVNGIAMLRPIIEEEPVIQPWQKVGSTTYQVFNDSVIATPVLIDRDLEEMKSWKKNEVDKLLKEKGAAGVVVPSTGGKVLQLRFPDDQANITAVAVQAALAIQAGVTWPANFRWRMKDNTYLPIATPQQFVQFAKFAADTVLEARSVGWQHKDNIEALTTAQAVFEYDITTGWSL